MGLLIRIDNQSATPLFRQIIKQVIKRVESGTLKQGERLPATRAMAERLGVNRSTVYKAYQELWSLGYLESRPGSYSTVRNRAKMATTTLPDDGSRIDWDTRLTPGAGALYKMIQRALPVHDKKVGSGLIDFTPLSPDSRLLPTDEFRKCINHVLLHEGARLLQYGSPQGYEQLRAFIARRMRLHGISISYDEIMITGGAQQAIDLVIKLLVTAGQGVVFEAPTYTRAMEVFTLNQVKMIPVPMTREGMDLDALEALLGKESPALVYTIPNFHNPTGITTSQQHRERLLSICERHAIPLVEDGFEEEMKYFGKVVLPIKSMDRGQVVIYLGTFSKVLFPGLRIGWIAADKRCIQGLVPIQRSTTLSGNTLDQAALERFCRLGHYDRHVKRVHRVYRRRMDAALSAISEFMAPFDITWTRPAGGYVIWVCLRGLETPENKLIDHLYRCGVRVVPGSSHFYGKPDGTYLRLSIAHLDESDIVEGIKRLAGAFEQLGCKQRSEPCHSI